MVIFCSFCVPRSLAETLTMPLASMSNVTSSAASPLAPPAQRSIVARERTLALQDVHFHTGLTVSGGRKDFALPGRIVVFREINVVMTPPSVSMPSESGVTSSSSRSLTSPESTPA